MAKKAISKIKIKSTGKTYYIKPDGYDELFDLVCRLCDVYGITRPNKSSYSNSTSPESQIVPSDDSGEGEGSVSPAKPTRGPELRVVYATGSTAYEYSTSMGDMRIYDDSSFRFINGDVEDDGVYVPEGKLITKSGGYQDPEVRDLPVDITVTKILLNNDELTLSGEEGVYDKENDKVIVRKYVDIPTSSVFAICGQHSFQLHYTDNYSGSNNRPNIGISTVFKYNFADGHLRIYDNGCYRLVPYSEVNGGQPSITPVQQGRFFSSIIDLSTFERCYFAGKSFTFDNSENVYEFYKDNIPGDRYTIDFYSTYSNQTSIDTTAFQNMYVSNIIKSGAEYVTVKPLTIESGTVTNGGGSNKECIELGSNSKLIVNLSYNGQIRADRIIVKCKKSGDDGSLTVNGIGPYEPVNSSSSPSDLVFEVSHLEAIQKIVLEATQNILVDSITVVKHNFDNDVIQSVNHGYFTITPSDFKGSLYIRNIEIKSSTSLYTYGTVDISPYDSRININFTKSEVVLDRSNMNTISNQLNEQGGETLFDFLHIDVGDGVDYLDDTVTIEEAIKNKISFFTDGSSISISNGEIDKCTWKKDTSNVVKIRYAGRTYDSTLTVRIIQTTDDVYIRRMNVNVYNTLYMGRTYTLRDFVTFIPEDVVTNDRYFSHMEIVHDAPESSVLNDTMDFQFITNKQYVTRTPSTLSPENAPHNWQEFWNWITITPVKTGSFTLYYLFRTDIGGGGGDVSVYIKDRP